MDGGGVTTDYLEAAGYPVQSWLWQHTRTPVSVGGVSPFEDERKAYTYGASRPSLRPVVVDENYEAEPKRKRKTRKRKPVRERKQYVPTPRRAPFKLQPFDLEPAHRKPVLDLAPPARPRTDTVQPAKGFTPPTGDDIDTLLEEIGDGPFPETAYPPNKKGFR